MEDNGDQTGRAVFKGNPALRPARLKRFDLIRHLRGICGSYRCKQCAELGRAVSAENGGICGQRFKIHKEGVLALRFRLIYSGGDELTEQTEGRDPAVIAGEAAVLLRPQILHLIGVISGLGGSGALKPACQPFALDAGIELIHAVQQQLRSGLIHIGICKRFGEQLARVRVRQIGVRYGFQRRLR